MVRSRPFAPLLAALPLLLGLGCAKNVEGDEGGECSDGADNDQNGYFDCDDLGCERSPDCEGLDTAAGGDTDTGGGDTDTGGGDTDTGGGDTDTGGADTGTDTGTDTGDTGTGTANTAHLQTYVVEMTVMWTFPEGGYDDCTQVFEGAGDQVAAEDGYVAFFGTYDRTASDCHPDLDYPMGAWYDETTGEAYAGFDFDATMSQMTAWYENDTLTDNYARAKWKIYEMAADYDDTAQWVHYTESGGDGTSVLVSFVVDVYFN